jgi:hypothetical protein
LVEETRSALHKGNQKALEEKVRTLDEATDRIPEAIRVFLALRAAINGRIHPVDPVLAMTLMEDLDDVETAFKSRNSAAPTKLNVLATKVGKAIEEISKRQPGGVRCQWGHSVPPGERYCPYREKPNDPPCGDDTWILGGKASVSSSTAGIRKKEVSTAELF